MNFDMKIVPSYHVSIFMAGDIDQARHYIRKFVMEGACVQLTPCEYVYAGGMESGFTARVIQYARFPKDESYIKDQAVRLAQYLAEKLSQISFSIEDNYFTECYQAEGYDKRS